MEIGEITFIEIWKDINNYESLYQVSNLGRVKSLERYVKYKGGHGRIQKERIVRPQIKESKYQIVVLVKNNVKSQPTLCRIVYETFNGKINNSTVISHKDDNRCNDELENLILLTKSDEVINSFKNKKRIKRQGEKNGSHKLIEEEVIEIIELLKSGEYFQTEIAKMYKVSASTISYINRNKLWKHVPR